MLTGALLLRYVRRKLSRLPVVGVVAAPILAFVPCTLLGAAAGAAVVCSLRDGDAAALRRRLRRAADEASAVAHQVRKDAKRVARDSERAARELTGHLVPALAGAAAEAERTLAPALARELEQGRRGVARSLAELEAVAAAAARDMEHARGPGGGGGSARHWRQQQQHGHRHGGAGEPETERSIARRFFLGGDRD